MTNKMAIRYLTPVKTFMKRQDFDRHYIEAMELAIKVLGTEPLSAEWVFTADGGSWHCSNCKGLVGFGSFHPKDNFCSNCGAKMRNVE